MTKNTSVSFSLEGYSFTKWILGNGSTLKEILKVGLPLVVSTLVVDPMWQQFLITVVGKFLLDGLEFFLSEVKLQ